ncbi:MAG: pantetheine-phosphate adenylyltransferase [Candidatus Nomurabacteria bacterium]|nr:pantetheine-phosphate adenylyltransferase [Candidatus Nomurabacteria bacterium]
MKPKNRIATFTGSFDPFTNGHLDIVQRMAPRYDKFIILVAVNQDKKSTFLFNTEERVDMIKKSVAHIFNVSVEILKNHYAVKYTYSLGAKKTIRGIRSDKDLLDEEIIAAINRKICPQVETIFVHCLPEFKAISSSIVKSLVGIDPTWKKIVSHLVPMVVLKKLNEKLLSSRRPEKVLWEILVPTHFNNHVKVEVEYHKKWDQFVQKITKGLTIENPTRGTWVNKEGITYQERMIPVKLLCTEKQINKIVDFTAEYYQQEAVLFYEVSRKVSVVNYDSNFKRKK